MLEEQQIEITEPVEKDKQTIPPPEPHPFIKVPTRLLNDHWLTISRPQYQRTCGISSLVSIWNFQFSKLGLGDKDPISIEQAMLKLNLIGKGSIEEGMRKKFKKVGELLQKTENTQSSKTIEEQKQEADPMDSKTLHQYIDTIDFGCFTGNDTLLKWYRLLCRIYGGSGRSYYFYKTNSERSMHKDQSSAKRGLVQGLSQKGKICYIYHAYDHYFCPVGYEFVSKTNQNDEQIDSSQLDQPDSQLYVFVGESSKRFPGMHVFKWSQIQLDLQTYWPQFYNIRQRKQGVQTRAGKQNEQPYTSTIDCIMAFEKIKD